jgi:hypothetical protein
MDIKNQNSLLLRDCMGGYLKVPDDFAAQVSRVPRDSHPPDDVRQHVDQAHCKVCKHD